MTDVGLTDVRAGPSQYVQWSDSGFQGAGCQIYEASGIKDR